MSALWSRLERVAPYFRTVLLCGEPGSGQESVARALHDLSPMRTRPFAVVDVAEAESQLASDHGHRIAATYGTLYLPEPARLSRPAQNGLLRLLRRRNAPPPHVVTFAPHGIRPLIAQGGFSSELAHLLASVEIEVPSLRSRSEDIPMLITCLLHERADQLGVATPELAADFLATAARLPWPGNLDQVQEVLDWLLQRGGDLLRGDLLRGNLLRGNLLRGGDLNSALAALSQTSASGQPGPRLVRLEQVIREQVQAVLLACNGNKLRAAEILGISRSTLYRMLEGSCGWTAAAAQTGPAGASDGQPRRKRQPSRATASAT